MIRNDEELRNLGFRNKNQVYEKKLKTWDEFCCFISEHCNWKGYIFRGQSCGDYELNTAFMRKFQEKIYQKSLDHSIIKEYDKQYKLLENKIIIKNKDDCFYVNPANSFKKLEKECYDFFKIIQDLPNDSDLLKHYHRFQNNVRGRLFLSDREYEVKNELWAIGQHYGLATPLLDWSASPFVAAYFAFEKHTFEKEYRAIYFLNAKRLNEMLYYCVNELVKDLNLTTSKSFTENNTCCCPIFSKTHNNDYHFEKVSLDEMEDKNDFYEKTEVIYKGVQKIASGKEPAFNEYEYQSCKFIMSFIENYFVEIVSPTSGENKRLVNQRGLFSKVPIYLLRKDSAQRDNSQKRCEKTCLSLEKWITDFYAAANDNEEIEYDDKKILPSKLINTETAGADKPLLFRVLLSNKEYLKIKMQLDAHNINHLSLYPDLIGSSEYANYKLNTESIK